MNGQLLGLAIGVLLLVWGRRAFWLFVGVVGFLWGFQMASHLLPANSQIAVLAASLALGLLGAVLAVFAQHLVVILAGFLAGGHLVTRLLTLYNWDCQQYVWWIVLLGGILGAILALMMLDWALIILSALIGANLVSQALPLDQSTTVLLVIILAISGILIQSRLLQRPVVVAEEPSFISNQLRVKDYWAQDLRLGGRALTRRLNPVPEPEMCRLRSGSACAL